MDTQTMKVKVENGELRIDAEELLNSLPPEDKAKIAKLIGADGEAWREMAEALVDPQGFFNADGDGPAWWLNDRAMLAAREKLLPLMPEVARHTIAALQKLLDDSNNEQRRFHDWAWAMWHAHQNWQHNPVPWPKLPDWAPAARDEMRVRDAAPGMRDALRAVEWSGGPSVDRCPFCNRTRAEGHREECKLAAAMRAADGEGQPT